MPLKVNNVNWFSMIVAATLAVLALGLGYLFGIAHADLSEDTQLLTIISPIANTLLSVVLVGVTSYYAVQTRRTVREMEKSRLLAFVPILSIHGSGKANNLHVIVKNVGKGLARKANIVVPYASTSMSDLGPNEERNTDLSISPDLPRQSTQQKLVVVYVDVFNRTHKSVAPIIIVNRLTNSISIGDWRYVEPEEYS